jgi:hypothetical protein
MASTVPPPRRPLRILAEVVCTVLLVHLGTPGLAAQEIRYEPLLSPLVPGGQVRLGFDPGFTSWDSRFGLRTENGTTVEEEEPLGNDLNDATGFTLFPGLATMQDDLDALTDQTNSPLNLGETQGSVTKNVTRLDFSAHVGVFDWLTVGATLPWVKTRTASELLFRPDADVNLGVNPMATDQGAVSGYLQSLTGAASQADTRAQGICDTQGAGAACDAAQSLAARAMDFATRAQRLYASSPFFLVTGSFMADALSTANAALAADLAAAGLPQPTGPVFADTPVDAETFAALPGRADTGLGGSTLGSVESLWKAGDLELDATLRLLDGEIRDPGAVSPRLAWTLAAGGLVRLGTGTPPDPDLYLDVGTGDGQMDIEGFGYGALRVGSHLALRASGRYGVQRSTTLQRRVAAPETVFAPLSTLRTVTWTPGSYLDLAVSPRVHVGETVALAVDYRRFHKGADEYALSGADDGVDVSLLERETEMTLQQAAVGLRYSTLPLARRGETGLPLEASVRVVRTVAGSGGQTPVSTRAELAIRLYRRLWGDS